MMAQTEDYSKRGLTLPYGYRLEMLMMRLCRWFSKKKITDMTRRWLERAQHSVKSLSPREEAFRNECNVMVVIRA